MIYSYLALGDSYTIGEQVQSVDSFPWQTVQILRSGGFVVYAPEIIATTGWTSYELNDAIGKTKLLNSYDIVSLLIGVNDQFRGRPTGEFLIGFEHLLQLAIGISGNHAEHVFVLSIPDWGITPFAEGKDRKKIAGEIDAFNRICESSAKRFGTNYIDITADQRKDGALAGYLAVDGLHPSAKEYSKWAVKLANAIKGKFQQ